MPKGKRQKKHAMFMKGAAGYQAWSGRSDFLYACPICQRELPEAALDSGELTLEDVPPAARGGSPLVLTCRTCNSVSGHTVDAHASRRDAAHRWQKAALQRSGEGRARMNVEIDGRPVVATVDASERGIIVVPDKKANHPDSIAAVSAYLAERFARGEGQGIIYRLVSRDRFKPRLAWLSDLRAAYLAAFAKFGYRFAFDARLDAVRSQLVQHDKEIWTPVRVSVEDREATTTLAAIEEPCYAVAVQIGSEVVLLPSLDGPADSFAALRQTIAGSKVLLNGHLIPWPTTLELALDVSSVARTRC
jgi:hypothetical protein